METIAFKPYACGTMTQPFIDCAIELAEDGVRAEDITDIVCEVGGGHRAPPVGAARRRSTGRRRRMRRSSARRSAWRSASSIARPASRSSPRRASTIPRCWRWPRRSAIVINPDDEYPRNFTGHLRATLDGRQPARVPPAPSCAAARTRRCRRRSWKRSSWTTRSTAAGARRWRSGCCAVSRDVFAAAARCRSTEFRA